MKAETMHGGAIEPRRSRQGIALGYYRQRPPNRMMRAGDLAELAPMAARKLGRELVRLSGRKGGRLPGGIWGLAEIAKAYGVSKQAVNEWRQHDDFPEPTELACGPIWDADAVHRWKRRRPARAVRGRTTTDVRPRFDNGRQTDKGRQP